MPLPGRSFRTHIERRVVVLVFVFCVLPLVALTWGSVRLIEIQTLGVAKRHLTEYSKDFALDLIDRLDVAVWELRYHPLRTGPDGAAPPWRWVEPRQGPAEARAGNKPMLRAADGGFDLVVQAEGRSRHGFVSNAALFSDLQYVPFGVYGCVLVAGVERRCDGDRPAPPTVRASWTLPLGSLYDTDVAIQVTSEQPTSIALANVGLYYRLLPYAVFVVMTIAGWWVMIQIRARFAPIAELERATLKVADGDYAHAVDIDSGDELERLGDAFNAMTRQLSDSFETMRALSAMDHMILNDASLEDLLRQALELVATQGPGRGIVWLWESDGRRGSLYSLDAAGRLTRASVSGPGSANPDRDTVLRALDDLGPFATESACCIMRDEEQVGVLATEAADASGSRHAGTLAEVADRISVAVTLHDRARALFRQANYDGLTGLLNREAFGEHISQALRSSARDGYRGALLCLDLDRFKQVNDTEGHQVGDRLLAKVAERLRRTLRASDEAARLGGDEFAVLVARVEDVAEVETLCRRLMDQISQPIDVDGSLLVVEVSVGVVVFPDDGDGTSVLMRKADMAMYKAKEQSGCAFAFFDEAMNRETEQRAQVERRLRQALKARELCLYFQPKVRLSDGAVVGLEGLLRWPAATDMHPGIFIPVAEQTGLIHELTDVLVEDAKACVDTCRERGFAIERVAINVSPRQFQRDGFAESFLERVAAHGASPRDFEIEVTESIFMHDPGAVSRELGRLRRAGVTVALDDFGTGYSSLNVLRELPLDVIKIDRSFVAPVAESSQAGDLIGRIIDIIRSLSLTSVAEGVETERELQILKAKRCDVVQGYLFSPALPVSELIEYLDRRGVRSA